MVSNLYRALLELFFHCAGYSLFYSGYFANSLAILLAFTARPVLALWKKRFEIVLLATIPVLGVFVATSYENRLLLAIPFWVMLMSFTFAALLNLRPWPGVQIVFCVSPD